MLLQLYVWSFWLLQEVEVGWDPRSLWHQMGSLAKFVVVGLFVAIPAVWMFNLFTGRIEAFDVEMGNSSSELIDYFLKRSQRGVRK